MHLFSAAKSGAVDAALARLIDVWPDLPAAIKVEIMVMVAKTISLKVKTGTVDN